MNDDLAVQALAALAQPVRLRVFRALVVAGPQGLTPSRLAEDLGISPSVLSFHLKELSHAGLIAAERASRHLIYRAQFEQMDGLLRYLTDNCCQGAPCAVETKAAGCGC